MLDIISHHRSANQIHNEIHCLGSLCKLNFDSCRFYGVILGASDYMLCHIGDIHFNLLRPNTVKKLLQQTMSKMCWLKWHIKFIPANPQIHTVNCLMLPPLYFTPGFKCSCYCLQYPFLAMVPRTMNWDMSFLW